MPRYDFARRALADLRDIARYTRETWGRKQARLYREELESIKSSLCHPPRVACERT